MPGPGTTQKAAGSPATSDAPFAMYSAPCSCRLTIGRMSGASTRASKKSSFWTPGRQNSVSMPAARTVATTCWATEVESVEFESVEFESVGAESVTDPLHVRQLPDRRSLHVVEPFERRPGVDV